MKIKLLATSAAPDYYSFSGDVITAYHGKEVEVYDLSAFPDGGIFEGAEPVNDVTAIRHIERIDGVLRVTLLQQVIAGQYPDRKAHWRESAWIDAADYDPNTCYVTPTGMAGVEDYEIVHGIDVAGVTGWTVRQVVTEEAS